ncbi:PDZ domain-containing protein, partial [Streptomyces sp. NRRL S-1896]|uniref:PDZ domain-containing protein n=1 Tax=Streptomyces sp. NRRL S-1896 TaxID=1463893 RepID=UPI0004CD5AB6
EQSTQENAEEFSQSQESAKVAALKELDIPVSIQVVVSTVVKGSPSEGKLHAGDVIKAVDGKAVKEPSDVADLAKLTPGEQHLIGRLVAFFATGDSIVANNL